MEIERFGNLKVGDRLPDGARVIDTRYAKQGAIGYEYDDPQTIARIDKALATYAAEYRRRKFGPWTLEELRKMEDRQERERQCPDSPLDSSI